MCVCALFDFLLCCSCCCIVCLHFALHCASLLLFLLLLQMRLFVVAVVVVVALARASKACPCGNLLLQLVTKAVSGIIKIMYNAGLTRFYAINLNSITKGGIN